MSLDDAPAISVVIPCRDERERLTQCLDALRAQDFPRDRYEIIVVDGGSTDGSVDVARAREARVLHDGGRGPAGARNIGIREARAPVVAFTDADCVPSRDWLTRIAESFAENPSLGGLAGSLRMPRDTLLGRMEDNDAIAYYRGFITSNIAYRRDVLLEVGGFDETLVCCEDYDLAWRVLDAGHRVAHDSRPVVSHNDPEVRGPLVAYLRKQFWYARSDVPAHACAVARFLARRERAPGSAAAVVESARGLQNVALAGAVVGGLATGAYGVAAAGLTATAALAARHTWRSMRAARAGAADLVPMTAVNAAKRLVRGAGTIGGLAGLAAPSNLRRITAWGSGASRAPRVTQAAPPPPTPRAPPWLPPPARA